MRIDPEYNDYFVYTAICHNGKQVSCGSCPVAWEGQTLIWADGSYHLNVSFWLENGEPDVVEDAIIALLNETGETFGKIKLNNPECEVRWCLLEKEQMNVVMDILC